MKRIMKLFPVALAAFALASCSSDDLNLNSNVQELTYSPDQLLVQIEGNEGVTRGGFMTTVADYSLKSAMFFKTGDQLKLYHDATSWKPEVWTAEDFGQYKNSTGTAVFKKTDATITKEENAYGIFPAGIGQFGNENRTSIQYDLSEMKFVEYSAVAHDYTLSDGTVVTPASDETDNTKAYEAPFPLWGVKNAGEEVMTMQHLAGILRVDFANIDNASMTNTQARYIVIKSNNVLSGKLATATDLLNPTAAEKVDVDNLMEKAPKLITKAATATTTLTAVKTTKAGITAEDAIVVELTNADPNHVMLFVPITAGNAGGDITVYVSKPVTKGADINLTSGVDLAKQADNTTDAIYTLDATTIQKENEAQLKGYATLTPAEQGKVQTGVFYRVNDDTSNRNTTAKTPFELTQAIIAADKVAYRDFSIYFDGNIEVKNEDTAPQNFVIDFSNATPNYGGEEYALKHNVTVYAKFQDKKVAKPAKLFIKSVTGGKTLTINFTNVAGSQAKLDEIVVEENLNGKLVLTNGGASKLPNITNYSDGLLTLKNAGTDFLYTYGKVTIDSDYGTTSERISNLILRKGAGAIDILNGDIENIKLGSGTDALTADVTIHTEGKTIIDKVDYTNMPQEVASGKFTDKFDLKFTSKRTDNGTVGSASAKTVITGIGGDINAITTVTGLMSDDYSADVNLLGEFDLNGPDFTWTPKIATKSLKGAEYVRADNNAAASTRAITGKATIKNLGGAQGLFATWTPAAANDEISNIVFDGTNNVKGASGANAIGLLVGEVVNTTASGVIKNIEVKGTNVIEGQGNGAGIGGLIGKVTNATNALILAGNKVGKSGNTTIKGFKNLGGIVGEAAGKVIFAAMKADGTLLSASGAAYDAATDVYNEADVEFDHYQIGGGEYSPNLATEGQFIGGGVCATAGDITIIGALEKDSRDNDKWGYYLADKDSEYFPWLIKLYYKEIGHLGFKTAIDGSGNNIVEVDGTNFNGIYNIVHTTGTTYGTTVTLNGIVSKTTPTGETATMKYFDWVKQPY